MHDSVGLERRGIPSAPICTTGFLNEGRRQAEEIGLAQLPLVEIAHPLSTLSREEIRGRAEQAVPQIVAVLTGPG